VEPSNASRRRLAGGTSVIRPGGDPDGPGPAGGGRGGDNGGSGGRARVRPVR